MEASKEGNYTPVVEELDSWVARNEYLCLVYIPHGYLMLPHCHLGVAVNETGHPMEPYWLSSVEIHLWTSYENK
jgi:hypothetical protein